MVYQNLMWHYATLVACAIHEFHFDAGVSV